MKIRVMLADDHTLFRQALRMMLEFATDLDVVAEVVDGPGVLREFGQCRPDVVLMDIGMPGLNGMETTRQLLAIQPEARVIGLSAHVDLPRIAAMVDAGALGYIIKGSTSSELLAGIRKVSQSQHYFDSALGINGLAKLAQFRDQTSPGDR